MVQIIEIIVDNNKYQIEWALSEHFDELRGKKFMINEMAADQIVNINNKLMFFNIPICNY